jgi:photosystem II stability/assembly factor-like uncharacterized protein
MRRKIKRVRLLLITLLVCFCASYACKKVITYIGDQPDILEKDGWYPLTTEFSSDTLYSVYFADMNTGYIVGTSGLIIKTINSGLKWAKQTSNITKSLKSVYFINENLGYTVGNDGIILKTINGGSNWIKQTSGVDHDLSSVYFTSENTGFVAGESGTILKTIDGGTNWLIQTSGTSNNINSVSIASTNIVFAVGDNGAILKTIDSGTNWELKLVSPDKNLKSVCFPATDTGYAAGVKTEYGANDIILKTSDGGVNWTQIKSDNSFRALHFVDKNTGYVVSGYRPTAKAAIYKTIDGGATWIGQTSLVKELYSIFFIDENIGFAVGTDRDDKVNIIKTKNGGED